MEPTDHLLNSLMESFILTSAQTPKDQKCNASNTIKSTY